MRVCIKTYRPQIAGLAIIFAIGGLLSGCSNTKDVAKLVTVDQKQININVWNVKDSEEDNMLDNTSKRFMQKYPNVNIKIQQVQKEDIEKLAVNLTTKKPDLFFTDSGSIGNMQENNLIGNLNGFMPDGFWDGIYQSAVNAVKYKDKLWMVPLRFSDLNCMIYDNKTVDKPFKQFNDIIKANTNPPQKLKGKIGFTYQADADSFLSFFNAFGGKLFDSNGNVTLNTKEMVHTLGYLRWLRNHGKIFTYKDEDIIEMLKNKKVAAVMGKNAKISQGKASGYTYSMLPYVEPAKSILKPFYSVKGFAVANNKLSKQKKNFIMDYIKFNVEKDVQMEFVNSKGYIGVQDKTVKDEIQKGDMKNILLQLQESIPEPVDSRMDRIFAIIDEYYQEVIDNKVTPEQAAANMQKEVSF